MTSQNETSSVTYKELVLSVLKREVEASINGQMTYKIGTITHEDGFRVVLSFYYKDRSVEFLMKPEMDTASYARKAKELLVY